MLSDSHVLDSLQEIYFYFNLKILVSEPPQNETNK